MSSNTINGQIYVGLSINRSHHGIHLVYPSIVYQLSTGPSRSLDDGAMPCSSWSPVPSVPCAATRRRCWESLRLQAEAADGEGLCWSWKPWNTARWNLPPGEQKFCFSSVTQDLNDLRFSEARHSSLSIFCETRSLWEGYSMLFPNLLGRHVGYDGSPEDVAVCSTLITAASEQLNQASTTSWPVSELLHEIQRRSLADIRNQKIITYYIYIYIHLQISATKWGGLGLQYRLPARIFLYKQEGLCPPFCIWNHFVVDSFQIIIFIL